jgi:uncharacterized repeat protein (TIGR01451 family)
VATVGNLTANAGGAVTFKLYGPDDATCAGTVIFTSTNNIGAVAGGVATATSGTYTATAAGTYRWVTSYDGDAKNKPVAGQCGDANESTVVDKAKPTITTDAQDTAKLPDATVNDTATLSGLNPGAGGTVVFRLYGPSSSPVCNDNGVNKNLVFTSGAVTVNGNGTYGPVSTQVTKAGTYYWIASYSGDANNESVTGTCGEATEVSSVDKASPGITTTATASTTLPGGTIKDTANVTGLTSDATGNVVFNLYGPSAQPDCTGTPVFTSTKAIGTVTGGAASVDSNTFTPTTAGSYYWTASYEGDSNNNPAIAACGADNETSVVNPNTPRISTVATASANIQLGGTISDAATVSGLAVAGTYGSVTFALYGPDDATCATTPVFTSTVALTATDNGDGTASGTAASGSFTPTATGTYRWIAAYNGDDNNNVIAGACNDPNEQSQVFAGDHPTLDKNSNPPSGSAVQPGSTINYTVTVGNTGDVAIGDNPVTDVLPLHVTVKAGTISDGGTLAGGVITWHVSLAPGATHTFTYSVTVDANAPENGVLLNTAKFLDLQDTTTHVVPSGDLALAKEVSPVAGHGVVVNFGDKLTYTLTASATGGLDQTDAVVKDYLPGRDPAHPKSGDVTYVAGSAKCIGAGTCTVTGPDANGLITWHLGAMAAGSSRQVTFQVIIKDVTGPAGTTIAEDIINQGTVQTHETPVTPSNVVVTPVSKVLPVKIGPKELPHTGAFLPVGPTVGGGILLLGLGILLVTITRRRRWQLLG